ncbi:MAG: hypothetical protein KR126chlam1_01313 [Chlamydiae bacterium]|nr:hypothetical protein [Chlamydiota bacterium]
MSTLPPIHEHSSEGPEWTLDGHFLSVNDPNSLLPQAPIDPKIEGQDELFTAIAEGLHIEGMDPLGKVSDLIIENQKALIRQVLEHGISRYATKIIHEALEKSDISQSDIQRIESLLKKNFSQEDSLQSLALRVSAYFRSNICSRFSKRIIDQFASCGYSLTAKNESTFVVCSTKSFKVISKTTFTNITHEAGSHPIKAIASSVFLFENEKPQFVDLKIQGFPNFLQMIQDIFDGDEETAIQRFGLISLEPLLQEVLPAEAKTSEVKGFNVLIKIIEIWRRLAETTPLKLTSEIFSPLEKKESASPGRHRRRKRKSKRGGEGTPSRPRLDASCSSVGVASPSPTRRRRRRASVAPTASLTEEDQRKKTLKFLYGVCAALNNTPLIGIEKSVPLPLQNLLSYLNPSAEKSLLSEDTATLFYAYLLLKRLEENDPTSLSAVITSASSEELPQLLEQAKTVMQQKNRDGLEFSIRHLSSLLQNWENSLHNPPIKVHMKLGLETVDIENLIQTTDKILNHLFIGTIHPKNAIEILPRASLLFAYAWQAALLNKTDSLEGAINVLVKTKGTIASKFPELTSDLLQCQLDALRCSLSLFSPENPSSNEITSTTSLFKSIWNHARGLIHSDEPYDKRQETLKHIEVLTNHIESSALPFDELYQLKALKFQLSLAKIILQCQKDLKEEDPDLPKILHNVMGFARYAELLGFEKLIFSYNLFKQLAERAEIKESEIKSLKQSDKKHCLDESFKKEAIDSPVLLIKENAPQGAQGNWIVYLFLSDLIESTISYSNATDLLDILPYINRDQLEVETFLAQNTDEFDTRFYLSAFMEFFDEFSNEKEISELPFCLKLFYNLEEKEFLSIQLLAALQNAFLVQKILHQRNEDDVFFLRSLSKFLEYKNKIVLWNPKDLSKELDLLNRMRIINTFEEELLEKYIDLPTLSSQNIEFYLKVFLIFKGWEPTKRENWEKPIRDYVTTNKDQLKKTQVGEIIDQGIKDKELDSSWEGLVSPPSSKRRRPSSARRAGSPFP